MKTLKDTLKSIQANKLHMIAVLVILVWCDMVITYTCLNTANNLNDGSIIVEELSIFASPAIDKLGLINGIILCGILNSVIVISMSLLLPLEYLFGVISGIFIMACYSNIRLFFAILEMFR
jgi:hypothetical protein